MSGSARALDHEGEFDMSNTKRGGAATVVRCLALLAIAAAAPAAAQQPATPGQIRPRPAEGRDPEFPPPNIREYKPRSTLVVPQHPVPRAKFPVVDIHGHPPPLSG